MATERVSVVDKGSYWFCFLDLSVMRDTALSVYDKAVYAALCSFVSGGNPGAGCFPSLESVAERASCSRRQVIRCIEALEAKGYIEVHRRAEKRKSSVYYLTRKRDDVVPDSHPTSDMESPVEKGWCQSVTSEVPHSHLTSDRESPEEESLNRESSKENHYSGGGDITPPAPPALESKTPVKIPYTEIVQSYNDILGDSLRRAKGTTKSRRKSIHARWSEVRERQSLEWWRKFFRLVKTMPFLLGRNDRNWQADLDWLLRETSMVNVLEGKYAAPIPPQRPDGAPGQGGVDLEALKEKYGGFVQ